MLEDVLKYLETLINCKSVTPCSNGAIEFIENELIKSGFTTQIKNFNVKSGVTNLYARYGNNAPNICFAGHIDVVDAGDIKAWRFPPFQLTEFQDKLYGRGIVDMKGAISVALSAALNFIKNNKIKGSISFLITSDEEGEAVFGTKEMLKYLNSNNEKIDFVILGEPTSSEKIGDTIKIGRRGSINFTLTIFGKQGHVAYPLEADNPFTKLIKILNDLKNYELDCGSELFDKSNLEITSINSANITSNVIPNQAQAKFNIRFNELHDFKTLRNLIIKVIEKYSNEYNLNNINSAESFIQPVNEYIAEFSNIVSKTCGILPQYSTSGGTSDARFIKNYYPVVEFGLCYKTAHKIDEYTEINDLQSLYNVYYNALCKFLKIPL